MTINRENVKLCKYINKVIDKIISKEIVSSMFIRERTKIKRLIYMQYFMSKQ